MNREFATFTVLIVALLVLLGLVVVVPEFRLRDRVDAEVRVIRALQEIGVAQHRYRIEGAGGAPGEEARRFGFLADLLASGDGGVPYLDLEVEGSPARDTVRLGAYRICVFLPDGDGRPVPASSGAEVDAACAARSFLALAAPVDPASGLRPYAVDQTLFVHEYRGEDPIEGAERMASPVDRLAEKDAETGKVHALALPEPWTATLVKAQMRTLKARFESLGVPLPRGLAEQEKR